MESDPGFQAALSEARAGHEEGGVPIGACLVAADGTILGKGRNERMQKGSATLHGETAAFENAGRLSGKTVKGSTMYTTLSPCDMCTGACLLYNVTRVVIGENKTYLGGEAYLKQRGVEVIVLDNAECKSMMADFIKKNPAEWADVVPHTQE
ncbi:cytidine deaminase-like protein [Microthyrium microscopicum]|uniref:Cytosine deaminase n=1 Tax=Microthyrium microscopicum TaxID=703497 RepID=A0A6A6UPK2_9PEZI|nr:cytidine deaminase-like protein [Microthyrium microscopicum]